MSRFNSINGERIPFTQEEEAARDAEEALWKAGQAKRDAETELARLEGEVTNRRLRDAVAGTENPTGWLANQEKLIKAQREYYIGEVKTHIK